MTKHVALLCLAVGAAAHLACRAQPIPLSARAGASFSVALVGEQWAGNTNAPSTVFNNVGFGSTQYWDESVVDLQRGEVEFFLIDAGNTFLLETQFVTRVFPDSVSLMAIQNGSLFFPLGNLGLGQVMAVVFIPPTTPATTYSLHARKVIRDFKGQDPPATVLASLTYNEPFEVLPAGPFGAPDYEKTPIATALADLYPKPKVIVRLPDSPLPAAAHIVVSVPGNVTVRSVFEEQHAGRASIVFWSEPQPGEVTIDFVNLEPSPQVGLLSIAYEPGIGYQRIDGSAGNTIDDHFQIDLAASSFWDTNGDLINLGANPPLPSLGPIR